MRALAAALMAALLVAPVRAQEFDDATRRGAQEAILIWRAEARANAAALDGCQSKLAARTPTVAVALTVPQVSLAPKQTEIWPYLAAGAGAVLLGLVAGMVAGVSLKSRD